MFWKCIHMIKNIITTKKNVFYFNKEYPCDSKDEFSAAITSVLILI